MKNKPAAAFGTIYGSHENPAFITSEGIPVWMWRKGQRVRFFTSTGDQIGPEQSNVAPAVCYAFSERWTDPDIPTSLNLACQFEVILVTQ